MAEPGIAAQGTSLIWGHVALVACTVLYLAWWLVFFNPRLPKAAGALYAVGVACIVGTAVLGITGVVLTVRGVGGLVPAMTRGVPVWAIAAGGIVAYVVLVLVTTRFFHRPVTTELVLFTGWLVLELCVVDSLFGAGAFGGAEAALLALMAVAVTAGCLACYVLYFNLAPFPSFVAGAAPLAAAGLASGVLAAAVAFA